MVNCKSLLNYEVKANRKHSKKKFTDDRVSYFDRLMLTSGNEEAVMGSLGRKGCGRFGEMVGCGVRRGAVMGGRGRGRRIGGECYVSDGRLRGVGGGGG